MSKLDFMSKFKPETRLLEIYFNNKMVLMCSELFKLEFDDNNKLVGIKNIRS